MRRLRAFDLPEVFAEPEAGSAHRAQDRHQRRQSTTVMRLTVVTTLSLVGTVATGFLGMNIFADAEEPLLQRALLFIGALLGTGVLTAYAVIKSKRLADLLDALSDESLGAGQRLRAIFGAWRRQP